MTTKVSGSLLSNTAVVPGTYGTSTTTPVITIDAQGRITSATATTVTGGTGGSGATTYTRTNFTATADQTVFTVDYTPGYLQVFLNGVLLGLADYAAANGTSITLSVGARAGDLVETIAYTVTKVQNLANGAAGAMVYQAAANTTAYTVVGTAGQVLLSGGSGNPTWSSNVQFTSIGVGTPASGSTGEIRATGDITGFYTSDITFKTDIKDIENPLMIVDAVGGKTYNWTDEYLESKGGEDGYFVRKEDFGVIAQDVRAVFPLAVRQKPNGTLAVDYEKLTAVAFAAIKELKKEIEILKEQIK